MVELPDPPPGARIRTKPGAVGIRLSWQPRPHRAAFVWGAAGLVTAGWFALTACEVAIQEGPGPSAERAATVGFLVASVTALGMAAALFLRLRSLAREALVLEPDGLSHLRAWSPARADVGAVPSAGGWSVFDGLRKLRDITHGRERTSVPKKGVRRIRLMGRGSFEHVAVETRSGHIDLGKHLGHAEREWLLEVLRRWRDAASVPPGPADAKSEGSGG